MGKVISILVLIAIVWGYQQHWKTGRAKTGVAVYSELRAKLSSSSNWRELEFVGIVKRDASEDCEAAKTWFEKSVLHCTEQAECQVVKNTCSYDIPKRYMKMFQGEPARTTYLKAVNPSLAREAILLFWGLTDEEAVEFCAKMQARAQARAKNEAVSSQCI